MADIIVDTYKLNQYAQRLSSVNARINRLDRRLDTLYSRVGLLGLWNLMQADSLTCYSYRLVRCQSYLQQTASDFESIERMLLGQDSSNFKGVAVGRVITTDRAVTSETTKSEDERSLFAKFINNDLKASGSVLSGEKSGEGEFLGVSAAGTVSGSILTGEAGIKSSGSWKFKDEDGNWNFQSFGFTTEAKASGAVAQGEVEGNYGYLHGKASGKALTGAVSGEAKCTLYEDGKFNPSLSVGAKAEGSVLQGEAEAGFGTDQYGVYAKAEGDVLHAEAEAKAGIGYIGKDEDGNAKYGVAAEASAMASIAEGKVKGGITIFGIDIDVGVKGYAGAAGVEAGGSISTEGVTANFSGALALGAGLDVSVDWSDAEWIGDSIDAVGDFVGDATDFVGDAAEVVGDAAGDFFEGAANVADDVGDFLFGWI